MKLIDIHTHVYPEKIARKATLSICDFYDMPSDNTGTAAELIEKGSKVGVEKYLILGVAIRPEQVSAINQFIKTECDAHEEFIGFGTAHAGMDNVLDAVEQIRSLGLRGIKMHPDTQYFNIDDERLYPLYEEIQGELPVYYHTGDYRYDYSHPRRVRRVLEDFPKLQVVAAHLGGWSVQDVAQEYLRDTNCLVDISSSLMFLTPEKAVEYIRAFGAERVMYGSDFPLGDPETEVERFMSLPLTDEEREQIAYATAAEFLKI